VPTEAAGLARGIPSQAAYDVKDAVPGVTGALNADSAKGAQAAAGVNFEVGLGGSSASSHTSTHDETSYGSQIKSGGDITIAATGGDLTIIGSQISGDNVALAAANNLNILSQEESHSLKNSSTNGSGGVGISIGSDGLGIYAQAAVGSSTTHGNGTTHAESQVDASGTLTLVSGNDTNIKGAQLAGNQVLASIGHDLNIVSDQDTDDYASKSMQAGGKVMVGITQSGFVSGSAYLSQGKVDSHYQSVNEVSGIQAGDGGFGIVVGNHTGLVGGQIASTADPSKNLLSTGSLSYADLTNQSKYNASQTSISGGSTLSSNVMGGLGAALSLATPQHENDTSTTHSGIAQGTLDIRSNPGQDLSGLVRDLSTLDANGIANSFDPNKVAETQELGQVAAQVGMHVAGDIASEMVKYATTDADKAAWSDGGIYKTILHGVVGAGAAALGGGNALQGAAGAVASEAASQAMQSYLIAQGIDPTNPETKNIFNTLMQLGSTAVGAAVGGGAGAAMAGAGDLYNRQLHPEEQQLAEKLAAQSNGQYTVEQIEDAMRLSGNSELNETSTTGLLVPIDQSGAIYDVHANWLLVSGPDGNAQYLLQQVPSQVSPDLVSYITSSTGGIYSSYKWSLDQQGKGKEPIIPWLAILPDYASVNLSALSLGGSAAVNLHTGQVYSGGAGTLPVDIGAKMEGPSQQRRRSANTGWLIYLWGSSRGL
jgi:filamentous hemagglutinin